ncbi:cysteine desulfurase [Candidatus Peregrinibacteria bacterium]|nr:cysteine desulfurase [Candidatus Peregrinibacteria bacterium]
MFNPKILKKDFPIFSRKINGKTLVYLDNASTSQKPKSVIDALTNYYKTFNANTHRGIHTMSEEATLAYEKTREHVAKFINAPLSKEIIFTRNTTEAINLVAYSWGETNIHKDDEIIISAIEHHSNLVPWQELCRRKKAKLKIIPIKNDLTLNMEAYEKMLSRETKLVSITGMSNVLGFMPDLQKIIKLAHKNKALVLVDAAQSAAHIKTDVKKLDCDFLAFSSHKLLGPTGVGALYGKFQLLSNMPPFMFGGDMVKAVQQDKAFWNDLPWKFEAGTPNIADVIAFNAALTYLEKVGLKNIQKHDEKLLKYAVKKFSKYEKDGVRLILPTYKSMDFSRSSDSKSHSFTRNSSSPTFDPSATSSILSFSIKGIHPHDVAQIFNDEGVAIRSGYHCSQPLIEYLNLSATARMSFYFYNTKEDIDRAEKALQKTLKLFK